MNQIIISPDTTDEFIQKEYQAISRWLCDWMLGRSSSFWPEEVVYDLRLWLKDRAEFVRREAAKYPMSGKQPVSSRGYWVYDIFCSQVFICVLLGVLQYKRVTTADSDEWTQVIRVVPLLFSVAQISE